MGGKSSAPAAPDYSGAAKETAAGNLANLRAQTTANRVDTFTPYGSLTYSNGQKFDEAGYTAAMDAYRQKQAAATNSANAPQAQPGQGNSGGSGWSMGQGGADESGNGGGSAAVQPPGNVGPAPDRKDFMSGDPDRWSSKIELSKDQQALLDQQNKTSLGLGNLQDAATGRVATMMGQPFDMSGVTKRASVYAGGQPLGSVLNPDDLTEVLPMGDVYTERQKLAGTYDANGAPKLSAYYDPKQDTNNATQAILSRVAPQLERDRATMDTQLANQGIVRGSEAWNNAQDAFGRRANDAYTQASLQGIDLGMKQQGQNFGQSVQGIDTGMQQQGQMFGQTLQNAGFRQGEQAQNFGQSDTNYKNSLAQRSQDAAIQGQMFGQSLQNAGFRQGEQAQTFGQSSAARQSDIEQQAYLRSLPLNELNALRTGSQVTNPSFTNAPQQGYTPGPDLLNAMQQNYGAQMQGVNASNAASAGQAQGAMSIAAMAAMAF